MATERKLALLAVFERTRLPNPSQVQRLHEVLCFLRAVPDDARVLARVEAMLDAFVRRPDLRRHRDALTGTGIAGTDLRLGFNAPIARWLASRAGERLHVDWEQVEESDEARLRDRIYHLALDAETPALDGADLSARAWLERMKGPDETDAAFLVRRFANVKWPPFLRDALFEELALPLLMRGDENTPSRTRARLPGGRVAWRTRPLDTTRPELPAAIDVPPLSIRRMTPREGRSVIELTQEAMVVRDRALDAFGGANPDDVRLVDCGDGLEFAIIGAKPDWRMLLETVYGWLTLRNRVPVGYVLTASFLRSAEVAYNVFDTWRGGDAGWVYGRVLATTRALFGADTFTVYPYQLGHGNPEGLKSGAWWFYQKLGFRPRDPDVLALMERELARMRRNPRYRSAIETLEELSRVNVFYELGKRRKAVLGTFRYDRFGLRVTDYLAKRFGSDREKGERVCADECAEMLGVDDWRRLPAGERGAWRKWAPLALTLPGVEDWTKAEKRAFAEVIRAKGGVREEDYLRKFDEHPRLPKTLEHL